MDAAAGAAGAGERKKTRARGAKRDIAGRENGSRLRRQAVFIKAARASQGGIELRIRRPEREEKKRERAAAAIAPAAHNEKFYGGGGGDCREEKGWNGKG